ncbi:LANO_0F15126g1_1 [Lachancea nothofagi CBS 11611]|uniref:Altered inheritance of mitochondria protein 32 n=1 Tax=Lachancea nothofagi CBS 11611 TaxID=1266666 RepID=A0A1G4KCG7_9SACH|nr:LANO_0F15126g1_1 [Lachancea nothofagi CBS 11611]
MITGIFRTRLSLRLGVKALCGKQAKLHTQYKHVNLKMSPDIQDSCDCFVKDLNKTLSKDGQLDFKSKLPAKTPQYHKHLMLVSPPNSAGQDPEWKAVWQSKLELNPKWPYSAIGELKKHLKETHRGDMILVYAISIARGELASLPNCAKKARFLAIPDMKVYEVSEDEVEEFAHFLGEGKIKNSKKVSFLDFLKGANATSKLLRAQSDPREGERFRIFEGQDYRKNIVLVCGHHQRDARCGIIAPQLIKELEPRVDSDLAIVSHIGGHKFAGNVIFYNYLGVNDQNTATVDGLWFGKILPSTIPVLLKHLSKNEIISPWFRGSYSLKE